MKKTLFLLFFIPTLSYSQITFEDIMSINSLKTFKRVMIENGFEREELDNEHRILYGLNIKRDSVKNSKSSLWGGYDERNGEFRFQISVKSGGGRDFFGRKIDEETGDNLYDEIVEKIKKNCKYYDVIENDGDDYVCYSCSQSTYKGKIGFTKSEGNGYIEHIIEKKPITFNDVMSINSPKTFKNVVNGRGYQFNNEDINWIDYGINISTDSIIDWRTYSSEWVVYNKKNDEFYFKFGYYDDYDDDFYDVLIDDIKKTCTFYDTLSGRNNRDYISYDCPQSTYKGKIGYTITDSVSYIRNIVPKEE